MSWISIMIVAAVVLILLLVLNSAGDTRKCQDCENRRWCEKHYYVCYEDKRDGN